MQNKNQFLEPSRIAAFIKIDQNENAIQRYVRAVGTKQKVSQLVIRQSYSTSVISLFFRARSTSSHFILFTLKFQIVLKTKVFNKMLIYSKQNLYLFTSPFQLLMY